ncbi:hypothetical protein EON63_05275 [archaeon]|nr:MAG: hypothetical protein EON63_05275 [archaeon]
MSAAQIFYPCMQCADVFFLKADICQLGMDQRKVCIFNYHHGFCDIIIDIVIRIIITVPRHHYLYCPSQTHTLHTQTHTLAHILTQYPYL